MRILPRAKRPALDILRPDAIWFSKVTGWLGLCGLAWLGLAYLWPAQAQVVPSPGPPQGIACAYNSTPPTVASGNAIWVQCDTQGKLLSTATTTVSGFAPNGNFANLTATGSSASVALPAGSVVLFQNTGTTVVSCTLGVGSATATANETQVAAGSWIALTPGSNTFGACIDQTGSASNLVVLSGGSGLATGAGGGGGGGGAVTIADGAAVNLGSLADAAWTSGSGTITAILKAVVNGINQGTAATATSVPASAIYEGVRGQNAEQTAVTNGQLVGVAADLTGKQIVLNFANPENYLNGQITAAMTATTSTAVTGMGAQGAGVRNYITGCVFSNSHATVGTMILLQDGSGGTTIAQAPAAAAFGGASVIFNPAIKTTANTGLFAANVTTGANTFVSCTGYKGI